MNFRGIFIAVASVLTMITVGCLGGSVVEQVDASEVVMIQGIGGSINWYKTPGWAPQWFGKVYRYPKRGTINFQPGVDGAPDKRLPIAFNDNGRALIKGSMGYELPLVDAELTAMHSAFPSQEALEMSLVKPALNKSVFLTGTLMTSYESYKEKRSMLIQYVEDQAQSGVYRTQTIERELEEETLNERGEPVIRKKKVPEVIIVQSDNQPVRNEEGQMARFKIKAFGFAIEDIDYDATVDKQIEDQQAITMSVQTSMAKAKQAIQDAVTAEATGRANVATARAQEEIGKTQAVVQGEKSRDVAALKVQEAESYKKEQILRAEADSGYKRAIMSADGALQQRLDAYKYAVDKISAAIAQHRLTPDTVIGATGDGKSMNALEAVMTLILRDQVKAVGLPELKPQQ